MGLVAGRFEVGRDGYIAPGIDARVGLRYDRFVVQARAAVMTLMPPQSGDDGYATRLGADARVSLWRDRVVERGKHGRPMHLARADAWLAGGLGREAIHAGAGELSRPDVALALGYSCLTRFGDTGDGHVVRSLGLELDAARAPTGGIDHSVVLMVEFTIGN